ncbi:putative ribonuclease H-like domain-containing protein [Tanacetum coccineum]
MMTQKLGNGFEFIKKACFVCGSFNHLIKDCDFHDNKMVEKLVLNNKGRVTCQREIRPVWNNVQMVNHQNKLTYPHPKMNFVPTLVAEKLGQVPVNAAKQNSPRAAASISTARPVKTDAPKSKVNDALPKTYSYFKAHSPGRLKHMTGNKSFLTNYQDVNGRFVAFVGSPKGCKITGKGKTRIGKLDFEDIYFVKELKFNLFSVSQMCDKKNNAFFTKTECLVLSPDFKLLDESQVLLKVPRQNNMYSFDLKNVFPSGGLTCLFAKATIDESNLWHSSTFRGLFRLFDLWLLIKVNANALNRSIGFDNPVRGLNPLGPPCQTDILWLIAVDGWMGRNADIKDGVSVKVNNVTTAGPKAVVSAAVGYRENAVKSLTCWIWRPTRNVIDHKSKESGSYMLKRFDYVDLQGRLKPMTGNKSFLTDYQEVDGGFVAFAGSPKGGIKREFSVSRTPQQNGVAERKNRTLIEATRTMLANSLLPTTFWAEAVNTACYVQNRVLVTKPHNKTPYELLLGRPPSISFMRPFGCPVTILNTLDPLGKFDGKADEGFLVLECKNSRKVKA